MNPVASVPPSLVDASVTPRALRASSATPSHDGLVLCDTAAYSNRSSTSTSCHFSNFGGNNHKRATPHLVTVEYRDVVRSFTPADFPTPILLKRATTAPRHRSHVPVSGDVDRARRYLNAIPPAVSGQHGDLRTFQTCCRLTRGFALTDDEAIEAIGEWNARCLPPWTERELRDKLRRARRYGREPIGGLLEHARRSGGPRVDHQPQRER